MRTCIRCGKPTDSEYDLCSNCGIDTSWSHKPIEPSEKLTSGYLQFSESCHSTTGKCLLADKVAALEKENKVLKDWKESALAVEALWDEQAVAKELKVGLGLTVRDKILPGIQSIRIRAEKAEESANSWKECLDMVRQDLQKLGVDLSQTPPYSTNDAMMNCFSKMWQVKVKALVDAVTKMKSSLKCDRESDDCAECAAEVMAEIGVKCPWLDTWAALAAVKDGK